MASVSGSRTSETLRVAGAFEFFHILCVVEFWRLYDTSVCLVLSLKVSRVKWKFITEGKEL